MDAEDAAPREAGDESVGGEGGGVSVSKFGEQSAEEGDEAGALGAEDSLHVGVGGERGAQRGGGVLGQLQETGGQHDPLEPRERRGADGRRQRVRLAARRRCVRVLLAACDGQARHLGDDVAEPLEQVCVREVELRRVGVAVWVAVRITDQPEDAHQVAAVRERPVDVERQQ